MTLTSAQRVLRSAVARRLRPRASAPIALALSPWLLYECHRNGWDPDDLRRIMAADNVAITAGSGTTIRTLDRSAVQTQIMGFDIAQSSEGELIGLGHGTTKKATSAGLTTASTNYTAGDQMGTEITVTTAARTGKSVTVVSAVLVDKAKVALSIDMLITDASITLAADNAAHAITDADALKVLTCPAIHFTDRIISGNNHIIGATNLPMLLKPASGTSLYAHFLAAAACNFFGAVGDMEGYLELAQD